MPSTCSVAVPGPGLLRLPLVTGGWRWLLGVVVVLWSAQAVATDMVPTPRHFEIVKTVLDVEGYISKELHGEFWAEIPSEIRDDPDHRKGFFNLFDRDFVSAKRFQRETWLSVKASAKARRVEKSAGYDAAKAATLIVPPGSELRQKVHQLVHISEDNIKAAVEGGPVRLPNGKRFRPTPDRLNTLISGLDGSLARFDRLAGPSWDVPLREYRYPEAHIVVMSEEPFVVDRKPFGTDRGLPLFVTKLKRRLGENKSIGVAFNEAPKLQRHSQRQVYQAVQAGIRRSLGVIPSKVDETPWRGRVSASCYGIVEDQGITTFVWVRMVALPELQGSLTFMATGPSKSETRFLREKIEAVTRVLH